MEKPVAQQLFEVLKANDLTQEQAYQALESVKSLLNECKVT